MFEGLSEFDLIEVMGEATRDESAAMAQRLAAVAELYIRREGALAETEWWLVDYCHAVAAEIAAVQNISHSRALGQVQYACNLRHRLPAVMRVFLTGGHRLAGGLSDPAPHRQRHPRTDRRAGRGHRAARYPLDEALAPTTTRPHRCLGGQVRPRRHPGAAQNR
jgi:hypothetical protein